MFFSAVESGQVGWSHEEEGGATASLSDHVSHYHLTNFTIVGGVVRDVVYVQLSCRKQLSSWLGRPCTANSWPIVSLFQLKNRSFNRQVCDFSPGWWFGTFFIFPYTGNFIIPTDELHFSEGQVNHQPVPIQLCAYPPLKRQKTMEFGGLAPEIQVPDGPRMQQAVAATVAISRSLNMVGKSPYKYMAMDQYL